MNMWQIRSQSSLAACQQSSVKHLHAAPCHGVACRHERLSPVPVLPAPSQQLHTCSSMHVQQRAIPQQRGMAIARSAADTSSAGVLGPAPVSLQLPQFCCGCGVRMQQTDPEAPGYFIIPAKLLEPRQEADVAPDIDEDLELDDYAVAQEDMIGMDEGKDEQGLPDVLCQRCFTLRHAGRVKSEAAESSLPEFDLSKKVGRKIALQKDRRAVVLLVVDASDFDGSLPREALRSLYPPGYDPAAAMAAEPGSDPVQPPVRFQLMLALNKVDLLPSQATPARLVQWVRVRMNQAGLPRPDKVFCVSANKGSGIKEMVEGIKAGLGFRGDLWVVGAQNAGKSSVISAMKRVGGTAGKREPTIAPLAGTTLGLINVPGLPLGPKHRAFDTPGVAHPHQLTGLLNTEEVRQVLPGKSMVGRTYRTSMGNTLLLGGLARIDVVDHPGATMYLTAFVSSFVNLHLGKTEGVEERVEKLVGGQLTPPADLDRFKELPAWQPRRVQVEGTGWDKSTVDVHIAGLGWVALGVKGRAELVVWAAPQVSVTTRPALVPDYAKDFCRPGFSILLPARGKQGAVMAGGKDPAPPKRSRAPSRRS